MSDAGDNDTVKTLAEMQATMKLLHEEVQTFKSGSTSMGINPSNAGISQPPAMPRGIQKSGSSSFRLGEAGKRKRSRETDKEDDDMRPDDEQPEYDDDFSLDDTETFPLLEAGNAFLETAFSKHMDKKMYKNHVQQLGTPDSRWSKCSKS